MSQEWVIVATVGTEEDARLKAGYLESRDVPCAIESLLFHQEPVNFGRLGEVRLKVPAEYAEEAKRLLAERVTGPSLVQEGSDEETESGSGAGEEVEEGKP